MTCGGQGLGRKMQTDEYSIEIFYSEEDEGYIAVSPEIAGCSAFGRTQEEALYELKTAMKLWLDVARRDGREIPKPRRKVAPCRG